MSLYSSADTGSGDTGVNLDAHMNGNPFRSNSAGVTVGHTWVLIVGAVVVVWLLALLFKNVRM